jgi:hypothetical protein
MVWYRDEAQPVTGMAHGGKAVAAITDDVMVTTTENPAVY